MSTRRDFIITDGNRIQTNVFGWAVYDEAEEYDDNNKGGFWFTGDKDGLSVFISRAQLKMMLADVKEFFPRKKAAKKIAYGEKQGGCCGGLCGTNVE